MKNTIIKKISFIVLICLINVIIFGFSPLEYREDGTIVLRATVDYDYIIKDIKELENLSEVIVRAEVLPNSENIMFDSSYGMTKTNIKIKEVYKGNVKKNDIIPIREQYFKRIFKGKTYIIFDDEYEESEVGREYIFFLRKVQNTDINNNVIEIYEMFETTMGRYPVVNNKLRSNIDVDNMDNSEFNLQEGANIDTYKDVFKEVISKYN